MVGYAKKKGRSESKGAYFGIPKTVMNHSNFYRLSGNATKLLLWLGKQFNGFNNGDLSATWSQVQNYGFRSKSTLAESRAELLHYRMVIIARHGGTNKPTLYALSWIPIHECNGKLDIDVTKTPCGGWKEIQPEYQSRSKRSRASKLKTAVAMRSKAVACVVMGPKAA